MHEVARRWLLLLGSSRDDSALMHAALQHLAGCGTASWLTPIQRFPADDHSSLVFYNALATWLPADGGVDAPTEIRRIETLLGRDRQRRDEVAIDIDLLAYSADTTWHAYAHAADKGEFDRALVRTLLLQAGVSIIRAGG